jgi:hypothetical protein
MRLSIMKALLAESLFISVLAVAPPLFVTTLTVARYRLSGEQTSLIFIDVLMTILSQRRTLQSHPTGLDKRK